ncbi:hypothetical protein B0H14DRAFT_2570229 [Mycena olivaceomarginata]|nr:hypothetical protein B0H14DRAFT_2570229 [Mycena olivaceomarginata]
MDGLNLFHSGFTSPHSFGSRTKSVPHPLSWNVIVAPSLPSLPFLLLLMSRDDPDYSSPFLGAHPSDTDLEETKFYADGPGIYPGNFCHGRSSGDGPRSLSVANYYCKLSLGASSPQYSRKEVSLFPLIWASAKANPHIVGWISTQISTIFAFLSTLIFSWSVRRSLTLHLRRDGMRLATFVSFLKIPTRSFIFEFQNPTFTLMAIVIIILTGVQTAGQQACIYWGILLLTLLLLKSSTWFPGTTTLPATIETVWDLLHSVTSKYLLVQQGIGFIADVSCEFWNCTDKTIPQFQFHNNTVKDWQDPQLVGSSISFATLESDCATDVLGEVIASILVNVLIIVLRGV